MTLLKHSFSKADKYKIVINSEWRRLQLLENAVLNYGGGLESLMIRLIDPCIDEKKTKQLHYDLFRYLNDIAKVASLDVEVYGLKNKDH